MPAHRGLGSKNATGLVATVAFGLAASLYYARGRRHRALRKLLKGNLALLSSQDQLAVRQLVQDGRSYLFKGWPAPGVRDAEKQRLVHTAASASSTSVDSVEAARLDVLLAPKALRQPKKLTAPNGHTREDPFYWMRDDERKSPEVLAHLEAENEYTRLVMADTEGLQEELYREMRGRIQEADQSTPSRLGGYFYYSRTLEGQQYKIHCRRRIPPGMGSPTEADVMDESQSEEVLLDENKEAAKYSFYMVGGLEVSPDHSRIAWGEDTEGGEKYTLYAKDLATGKQLLAKPIKGTAGSVAWANDNKTLFYVTKDKLDRPEKVWRHHIGSTAEDVLVFHEPDESFYVGLDRSRSDQMLLITCGSAVTSETRFLSADTPAGEWTVVLPRQHDVEYEVSHRGNHFFITLRDSQRPNSELLVAPVADPTAAKVLIPHRRDVKLEGVATSASYLAVQQRVQGLQTATVHRLPPNLAMPAQLDEGEKVEFEEPAYELGIGGEGDFDSPVLRLRYTSLTTPSSVIDHHMGTGKRATKKVQPVLGGFRAEDYGTERLWAMAPDGTRVPISIAYRRDLLKRDGSNPLLLDGYGSYEICNDPYFSSNRLSLLDRGFVFAIAHIRGGGEMGRFWYEDGKFLKKKNTFTDFVACAEHLIAQKWTSQEHLCIEGRSAGGLLMGAVLNLRPDLFAAAVAGVPFVDCLTTMLDDSIPLTTIEYDEWGNPNKPDYYEYMRSYSPVDNVARQAYPHILVTGGLNDPRVGYWEPAKWVAKLRGAKTDRNLLLFKCELGAGHFSQSGRFDRLKEVALEYAFLLKTQGMTRVAPAKEAPALEAAV